MPDLHADLVSILTIGENVSNQSVKDLAEQFVDIGGFVQVSEAEPVGNTERKRGKEWVISPKSFVAGGGSAKNC